VHEKPLILTAAPPTFLERLDARVKLLLALVWAICIVTIPRGRYLPFGVYAAILIVLLVGNRGLAGKFARRLLPALPALALVCVVLPFFSHGEPVWRWGVLTVTRAGLQTAARVGAAATLCVGAVALVWASTSQDALLVGLRGLGLPSLFVGTLGFMLRYLEVLRPELHRLTDARAARAVGQVGPGRLRSGANVLGALFLRAQERAEHVGEAMVARGYAGRLRTFQHSHFHLRDVVVGIGFPVVVIAVRVLLGS